MMHRIELRNFHSSFRYRGERRGLVVSTEDCQSKGRGIKSRSFSLLIASFLFIRLFDIIRPINTFHVANDLSTHSSDGSVERHARRDEEEGPAGVSGMSTGLEKG